jgi:hypothetical protein
MMRQELEALAETCDGLAVEMAVHPLTESAYKLVARDIRAILAAEPDPDRVEAVAALLWERDSPIPWKDAQDWYRPEYLGRAARICALFEGEGGLRASTVLAWLKERGGESWKATIRDVEYAIKNLRSSPLAVASSTETPLSDAAKGYLGRMADEKALRASESGLRERVMEVLSSTDFRTAFEDYLSLPPRAGDEKECRIQARELVEIVRVQVASALAITPLQKQGLRGVGMSLLHGKALLDYKLPSGRGEAASREAFVSGWLEAVGQSFKDRQDAIDSAHRAFRKYAEGVNAPPPRSPSAPVAP